MQHLLGRHRLFECKHTLGAAFAPCSIACTVRRCKDPDLATPYSAFAGKLASPIKHAATDACLKQQPYCLLPRSAFISILAVVVTSSMCSVLDGGGGSGVACVQGPEVSWDGACRLPSHQRLDG